MAHPIAEADQKDQIVITLNETETTELCLRSVDVYSQSLKVRFSSQSARSVEDVFRKEVAEMVRRICASASLARQIINVPDFTLRLAGLSIKGYTLLVHTIDSGLRQFVIRLKRGIGNALAIFVKPEETTSGLSLHPEQIWTDRSNGVTPVRLFDEMLSHLYLPLVNLNNYLRQVLEVGREPNGAQFSSSMVQIKTKAEVLQFAFDRLISEVMLEKYANGGDPVAQAAEPAPPAIENRPARKMAG